MNKKELKEVLEKHKLWLEHKDGGECADLSGAYLRDANLCDVDLSGADLRDANLRYAYLRDANLSDADLDFSQLNLSCKGLNFKIGERIAKQLAYHLVNLMDYSGLNLPNDLRAFANESHVIEDHDMPRLLKEETK